MWSVVLLWVQVVLAAAPAGEWFVEGAASLRRVDASGLVQAAQKEGLSARLIRRYRHGVGWEYVGVVEGLSGEEEATEIADRLAEVSGQSVAVYSSKASTRSSSPTTSGGTAPPSGEVASKAAGGAVRTDDLLKTRVDSDVETLDVDDLLRRVVRAHGGRDGGVSVLDGAEGTLVFRFRRRTDGGLLVEHLFARRGEEQYSEVQVLEGTGRSSRSWLLEEGAWLQVDGGTPVVQNRDRLKEVVESFSPERVLSFALRFPSVYEERPELGRLYADVRREVGDRPCVVLRYDGDRVSGPMWMAVDEARYRIREVGFGVEGEEVVQSFGDYRDVTRALVVPWNARTIREGRVVDDVEVLAFELDYSGGAVWFAAPVDLP